MPYLERNKTIAELNISLQGTKSVEEEKSVEEVKREEDFDKMKKHADQMMS